MRLRRLPGLAAGVLALLLLAVPTAAAAAAPEPAVAAAQEAAPAAEEEAAPRFWEQGGSLDRAFGRALEVAAYVPFFNLLGGPNAEPLRDASGEPVIGPQGEPVVIELPLVVLWLVIGSIFFTLAYRFVNFRLFRHAVEVVRGRFDNPDDPGEVSHFQALASALSATVGLGNIAGVAIAISLGGPGAMFWMIIAGFLGMSLKFTECTLGQRFRKVDERGNISGGPMRYLKEGLRERGLGPLGMLLSFLFIVFCIGGSLAGGNAFQVSQSLGILQEEVPLFREHGWIYGGVLAFFVGIVIIGGIQRIALAAEKIVPAMCVVYVLAGLIVILGNLDKVPFAFGQIFAGAMGPGALYGGVVGTLVMGFQRAVFSNEAGVGSAAIAHSAARTEYPAREGLVALLGPFIDTVVICTMTALVIVITGVFDPVGPHSDLVATTQGAALTRAAFGEVEILAIGTWFPWVLLVAVILFAYSTMISWSYYGERCWTTLFGPNASLSYRILFLVFVVLGSIVSATNVLEFGDLMILAMAFPNILGLYILRGYVREELVDYERKLAAGEIKPYK